MATAILMPKQGNSVESCLIAGWKKKVGDQVSEGEVLCEVETDKAIMELVARGDGVLGKIIAPEGTTLEVGELVGIPVVDHVVVTEAGFVSIRERM